MGGLMVVYGHLLSLYVKGVPDQDSNTHSHSHHLIGAHLLGRVGGLFAGVGAVPFRGGDLPGIVGCVFACRW